MSDELKQEENEEVTHPVKIGRIEVDKDLCISAASCVAIAPGVYQLDSEGKAEVYNAKGGSVEDIMNAAKSCPVDAIFIYDEEGNLIWPKPAKILSDKT